MVEKTLEIESADADQLELYYLVDCVLDEIEEAKALKRKAKSDNGEHIADGLFFTEGDLVEIMPEAALESRTQTDLMDQIESALSPFDVGDDGYHFFDGPFHPADRNYIAPDNSLPAHPSEANTLESIADDLAEQIDMDNEYLSYVTDKVTNSNSNPSGYSSASKCSATDRQCHFVTESVSIVPEDIMQTAMSLQNFTKTTNSETSVNNISVSDTHISNSVPSETCANKEYLKHFNELQQYSDLIRLPDMTSRTQQSTSSTQGNSSSCQQTHQQSHLLQNHSYHDDDSNDTSSSEFMSWTIKHPENWSTTEVLDWLYYSAEKHGADCSLLRGEAFRTVNGSKLCKMGQEEFQALDPYFGDFLYKLFRKLVDGLHFTLPDSSFSDASDLDQTYCDVQGRRISMTTTSNDLHSNHVPCDVSPCSGTSTHTSTHTSPDVYPVNSERYVQYEYIYAQNGAQVTGTHVPEQHTVYNYTLGHQQISYPYDFAGTHYGPMSPKSQYKVTARERYDSNGTPRRRPGRPRIKSLPTEEELQAQREKKMKSQHLWEFIYDMLTNPLYNPSVLKWENQSEGVFRFVQSETVAQLWGTLKSNENMTYEKLSRAMRHYYKRGILERVEGRRLVYKFSRGTLERMRQKKAMANEVTATSLSS